MRVAPCGWFAKSIGEAEALAERSAAFYILDDRFASVINAWLERDPDRYDNTDDEDICLFNYLFARGLMRLSVDVPHDDSDPEWSIKAWSNFGRMIL